MVTNLGERIRVVRIIAGLKQSEMAEELDISETTLIRLEKGRKLSGFTVTVAEHNLKRIINGLYEEDQLFIGGNLLRISRKIMRVKIRSMAAMYKVRESTIATWEDSFHRINSTKYIACRNRMRGLAVEHCQNIGLPRGLIQMFKRDKWSR